MEPPLKSTDDTCAASTSVITCTITGSSIRTITRASIGEYSDDSEHSGYLADREDSESEGSGFQADTEESDSEGKGQLIDTEDSY